MTSPHIEAIARAMMEADGWSTAFVGGKNGWTTPVQKAALSSATLAFTMSVEICAKEAEKEGERCDGQTQGEDLGVLPVRFTWGMRGATSRVIANTIRALIPKEVG